MKQNVFWFIHDSENSDDDDDEVEYIELGSDQDVLSDQKESLPQQSELITTGKLQSKQLSRLRNIIIVACHLPQGSKIRWREDMGGGLTSAREYNCCHKRV